MTDRPIRPTTHGFANDSATTTHLTKALTTAHLQQAISQSVVAPVPAPAAQAPTATTTSGGGSNKS